LAGKQLRELSVSAKLRQGLIVVAHRLIRIRSPE